MKQLKLKSHIIHICVDAMSLFKCLNCNNTKYHIRYSNELDKLFEHKSALPKSTLVICSNCREKYSIKFKQNVSFIICPTCKEKYLIILIINQFVEADADFLIYICKNCNSI